MTLQIGDTHKGWTVTEVTPSGLLVLHRPCDSCGCPKGMEWRTTQTRLAERASVVKSHSCIAYLRDRIEKLEALLSAN